MVRPHYNRTHRYASERIRDAALADQPRPRGHRKAPRGSAAGGPEGGAGDAGEAVRQPREAHRGATRRRGRRRANGDSEQVGAPRHRDPVGNGRDEPEEPQAIRLNQARESPDARTTSTAAAAAKKAVISVFFVSSTMRERMLS